jgi:hypothetical protein
MLGFSPCKSWEGIHLKTDLFSAACSAPDGGSSGNSPFIRGFFRNLFNPLGIATEAWKVSKLTIQQFSYSMRQIGKTEI